MSHSIEQLARSIRAALKSQPGPTGRSKACEALSEALKDQAFIDATFSADTSERHVLYEDPELGFCILAHNYKDAKESPPHDHGPSWAIYGQAAGETEMSDWELIEPAGDEKPGKVRRRRTYKLAPGVCHVYNEGDLHSPRRAGPTRLIRIEGVNLERVKRHRYQAI
jgi:hypothetical protein